MVSGTSTRPTATTSTRSSATTSTKRSCRQQVAEEEEQQEVVDVWTARELQDCFADGKELINTMVRSLKSRQAKCSNPAVEMLGRCIDLHSLVCQVCGSLKPSGSPYDIIALTLYGAEEFNKYVKFLNTLPHIRIDDSLQFHPNMASRIHDKIKEAIVSVIWGDNFSNVGAYCLKIVEGEQSTERQTSQ